MNQVTGKKDDWVSTILKEICWKVLKNILEQNILNIMRLLQKEKCIKKINKLRKRLTLLIKLTLIIKTLEQIFLSCLLAFTSVVFYVVDKMFENSSKTITIREEGKHSVQGLEAKEKAAYNNSTAKNIENDKKTIPFCKSAHDKAFDHNQATKPRLELLQSQKNTLSSEYVLHAMIIDWISKPRVVLPKKDNTTKQEEFHKESTQIHKIHNNDVTDSIKKERRYFIGEERGEGQNNNENCYLKWIYITDMKDNEKDNTTQQIGKVSEESTQIHKIHNSDVTDSIKKELECFMGIERGEGQNNNENCYLKGICITDMKDNEMDRANDGLGSICSKLTEVTVSNNLSFNIHDY